MDVATFLRRGIVDHADREAVVFENVRLTFSQVSKRANALAYGLAELGLKDQDAVAVLEDNNIPAVDAFIGLALGGFVRVPLYARNASSGHASMLSLAGCKALLVGPEHFNEVAELKDALPDLKHVIITDGNYERWLLEYMDQSVDVKVNGSSLFAIRFTGGTTGLPKGVPTTHSQFLNQVRDWFYAFPPAASEDAVLHAAPITHASGSLLLPLWAAGGRNILMRQFDPSAVLSAFEQERVSYVFLPPTAINVLTRHPEVAARDHAHLKVLMTAAAPINEDTTLRARACFGDVLFQGYGLSECFPIAMMSATEWFASVEGSDPLRACGKPLPFVNVQIWNDDNEVLKRGEIGEIVAQCDGQMTAYWQSPQETAETLVDGWIKTGDVGRLDENGYLYVLDRKKDLIISGGFNLYPAEIENVVAAIPGVVEVAVIGAPDERWGEAPIAIVVTDSDLSSEVVLQAVGERLGSYKKPREVVISRDPLPKTPVGKLDKKVLREPYWKGRTRGVSGA